MGIHDGHRGRLKERYAAEGGENFATHNLLELLLFYAIPRRDTNETAHRLLKHFGTVNSVLEASVEELCTVKGINESSAILIRLVGELGMRYCNSDKTNLLLLASYNELDHFVIEQFSAVQDERVIALYTDVAGRLLKQETVCVGDVNSATMDMRKIVSTAMACNAATVVLAHNHPGGVAIPSSQDLDTTRKLRAVLSSAGVELVEHYIVADDGICRIMESSGERDANTVELRQYRRFPLK